MSTNTQEIVRAFSSVVAQDLKTKFIATYKGSMPQNETNAKIMEVIVGLLDTAIKQTVEGSPSLNIPIAGAASNHAGQNGFGQSNALSGFVANVGPQAQTGFGGAPQQQQFGNFPQQPQGGNVQPPKDAKLSLQECGVSRVPNHIQNPNGAKCGVAHTSNQCPGATLYCDKPAVKQGTCGSWTCNGHAKRETADAKGKGGKKSGGNAVSSAQQIVGMQTPSFMPTGFGHNPGMVNNVTSMMQQQPHAPSPFAQFGQAPPANHAMSNQLTSSMQSQINGIPQNNPLPPQGTFNFNTVMQSPAPSAVAVNPAFGGVPSTPNPPQQNGQTQFGGQQVGFGGFAQQAPVSFGQFGQTPVNIQPQATQVQGFQEGPEDGSSDEESSDEAEGPTPIPVTDPAQLAAVNAAAGLAPPATFSFGAPAPQQVSFGQPAAVASPNPLLAAVQVQQQQTQVAAPAAEINPLLAAVNQVSAAQPK